MLRRLFYRSLLLLFIFLPISAYAQRMSVSRDKPTAIFTKGQQQIRLGNVERGITLITQAAGKGLEDAQMFLANNYLLGTYTKIDYQEAGYWFENASKNGNAQASTELAKLIESGNYKPQVASSSTPQTQIVYYQINGSSEMPNNNSQQESATKKRCSDVDMDIPTTKIINNGTIVIIIANENYQEVPQVAYANNDGETFKDYCIKTLGVPEKQVHLVKDATLNKMRMELNWLNNIINVADFKNKANVIFYYAGHGVPDEATRETYLLPVDGVANMASSGYKLSELYKTLDAMPAKRVTVFMDACFSGSQRGDGMLASARGVKIKPKAEQAKGNRVVFSAASGDETAYPYKARQHGLFTYYLMKKLQESNGECTYGELDSYIHDNVSRDAMLENGKPQTPTVSAVGEEWKNDKFINN